MSVNTGFKKHAFLCWIAPLCLCSIETQKIRLNNFILILHLSINYLVGALVCFIPFLDSNSYTQSLNVLPALSITLAIEKSLKFCMLIFKFCSTPVLPALNSILKFCLGHCFALFTLLLYSRALFFRFFNCCSCQILKISSYLDQSSENQNVKYVHYCITTALLSNASPRYSELVLLMLFVKILGRKKNLYS